MPLPRLLRPLLGVLFAVVLTGCIDPEDLNGGTGGTALYVFDASAGAVLVWDDLGALESAATAPDPSRRLTGSLLANNRTLAWGGMCFDPSRNRLFLVSETGTVVRIEGVSRKNGELASSQDIASFTLDNAERLSESVFAQAAVDPQDGTLYVAENGKSSSRIWVVANAGSLSTGATASLQALQASGDTGGTGVAVAQGMVYAYAGGGSSITTPSAEVLSGSRLRRGTSGGFNAVVLGGQTTLGSSGSNGFLALDTGSNLLYVARKNPDLTTGGPIALFEAGAFTTGFNQAPQAQLGTWADQGHLKFLSHGGSKDWLVAADEVAGTPTDRIWIWRRPSAAGSPKSFNLGGGVLVRGLALDGSS